MPLFYVKEKPMSDLEIENFRLRLSDGFMNSISVETSMLLTTF